MKKALDFFHHLLVPKEDNNFRAKALHTDFLTYYLIIALFLTFIFKQTAFSNVLGFATDITIDKLYQLTNQERVKNNLSDLTYSEKLSQAAAKKAADMFSKNYWAHYGPNSETPWDFILSSGYSYEYAGENLAKNFLFSQGVVDAWMKSPTHRENILRSNYTEVGYAVVNGVLNGEQTTLVVQMFGKPQSVSVVARNNPPPKPSAPSPIPTTAAAAVNKSAGVILAKQTGPITFNINIAFLLFLMLALVMDLYFASKLHVIRINGKNLAHFIFIGFIIAGLLIVSRGAIL